LTALVELRSFVMHRRSTEDGLLMGLIELALLLLYVCVLLIKSCDLESVQVDPEVTTIALQAALRSTCRGYGFGDTASGAPCRIEPARSLYANLCLCFMTVPLLCDLRPVAWQGVVEFFIFFGLSLLVLQPVMLALRYSSADYVPKVVLLALSHSVAPSLIVKRVISRR
jgi:hypothetical protein